MTDDLFQPTLDTEPVLPLPPWRPDSIFYPAFFGGPLAATVLGVANAWKLALGRRMILGLAAFGLAVVTVRITVAVALPDTDTRLLHFIAGFAVFAVVFATQRKPFRAYEYGWVPAGIAVPGWLTGIGCWFAETVTINLAIAA